MIREAAIILEYIKRCHAENHYYPTQDEISKACHMAKSTVNKYFTVLIARGHIERVPNRHAYYLAAH